MFVPNNDPDDGTVCFPNIWISVRFSSLLQFVWLWGFHRLIFSVALSLDVSLP